ncbi:MAG: NAD(P)/FAD-dependent oxidoreductase [Bryobacterales bacterium]|nr:NAD(P)/FAD-dependent oxidoreductase [Bryobacterales bacterium]
MNDGRPYDAIVIGGGPAGSTAAALLAEKGRRVVVLEREAFPRYHVGESLIPYCYFTLKRLGLIERLRASNFPKKLSVQFASTSGNISAPFYFFQHLDHEASTTWQVVRSEFDRILLDNAREKGADVHQPVTARELIWSNGAVAGVNAVSATGEPREFLAPVTIDATGRDAFAIVRNGWRVRDPRLNKIAIWTYYKGALRDQGLDEGATTIAHIPEKGWFWYIPLPDDIVSVGVVAEKDYLYREGRDVQIIFEREVKNNPWVERHLASGERTEPHSVTGEFSYRSRHCAADGLVLAGDAFSFLDPVFSSGLFLALRGGELAADAVDAALDAGDVSAARFSTYGTEVCRNIEAMRKLVYAFYDPGFSFRSLLTEYPGLRGDLTDCLIGNVERDFGPLFDAAAKFAAVPEPLAHGKPLIADGVVA